MKRCTTALSLAVLLLLAVPTSAAGRRDDDDAWFTRLAKVVKQMVVHVFDDNNPTVPKP
jgi:hypothetical protein